MTTLEDLKAADKATRPSGANEDWNAQALAYDDQAKQWTLDVLKAMNVGLKNQEHPIQVNLLRRVVDRLACVYDTPATRWLVKPSGDRYSERSTEHRAMIRILRRARYDLALRHIDRRRALLRQVVVRYYASDPRKSVVLRTFDPTQVIRMPDPAAPDELGSDIAFALKLRSNDDPIWEMWQRNGDEWSMAYVNDKGEALETQPFSATGLVSPYPTLPAQLIFDEYAGGRAWLPPRASRTAWVAAINAVMADLQSLIVSQAHTEVAYTTDNPDGIPSEYGHNVRAALPRDTEIQTIDHNPKIGECKEILEEMVKLWVGSEDLPTEEFQKGRQVVTGASLRVQEAPLLARREAQVALAPEDERIGFECLRAVHNLHAVAWGAPLLPGDAEMEVEIGDPNLPVDARELYDVGLKGIAAGTWSRIDLIKAERNVSRYEAIRVYERVKRDNEEYPGPVTVATETETEPAIPGDVEGAPNAGASVLQNLQAIQAASSQAA